MNEWPLLVILGAWGAALVAGVVYIAGRVILGLIGVI